jgi:hypothetical protein
MDDSDLKIACGRWLTSLAASGRKADVRQDGDELRKSVLRLSSSPQGHPEQIHGKAPVGEDIAAGREASGPMLRHRVTGRSQIPVGAWPRQMCAVLAAAYCGEVKVEDFLARVGTVYPYPRVRDGRRQLWLRDDLDRALLPKEWLPVTDAAEDL